MTARELYLRLAETQNISNADIAELGELVAASAEIQTANADMQKAQQRWRAAIAKFTEMQP